jgi:hypothetical protein
MALGSTQPLTEMSTRCISVFPGGKGGRCVRLTTLPPSCAIVMKSGNLKFLEPSGPLQACNGTALPVTFYYIQYISRFSAIQESEDKAFYKGGGKSHVSCLNTTTPSLSHLYANSVFYCQYQVAQYD